MTSSTLFAILFLASNFAFSFSVSEHEAFAREFLNVYNKRAEKLVEKQFKALWKYYKNMSKDNEDLVSKTEVESSSFTKKMAKAAKYFHLGGLSNRTSRQLLMMREGNGSPDSAETTEELSRTVSEMTKALGYAKICNNTKDFMNTSACPKNLQLIEGDLLYILSTSLDYDRRWFAWNSWHTAVGRKVRPLFTKYVELSNIGARDYGYANAGEMWRMAYELHPRVLEQEMMRLWEELRPLYLKLHAYVRHKLRDVYGVDKVSVDGPIPVHLLDMTGFNWNYLSGLIKPFPYQSDVTIWPRMRVNMTKVRMEEIVEEFYESIGLGPMVPGFWKKSFLSREGLQTVDCMPSAWDVAPGDYRIKMPCLTLSDNDFYTFVHEMGHIVYFMAYSSQPFVFRGGANPAFHEAVGDAVTLSTRVPSYLKHVGLMEADSKADTSDEVALNSLMKEALHMVVILPFALIVDLWRWRIFSGEVHVSRYNRAWWDLKRKYLGVASPQDRTEDEFDPATIAHICNSTPYVRYYLGAVLEFQFHEAMCKAARHKGALHKCSVYGSKNAGSKLRAMLELGRSKPWPDVLQVLTGQRSFNSSALLNYFRPLSDWLGKKRQKEEYPEGWDEQSNDTAL